MKLHNIFAKLLQQLKSNVLGCFVSVLKNLREACLRMQLPVTKNIYFDNHRSKIANGRSYFCFSAKQKGEWNIFFVIWMTLFVAIIALIVDYFGEKYSFEEIFSTLIVGIFTILGLLSILADVLVRLFRFFFGRKSKHKDDNLS
jgi:hypothetical protein